LKVVDAPSHWRLDATPDYTDDVDESKLGSASLKNENIQTGVVEYITGIDMDKPLGVERVRQLSGRNQH
jgi:hypothetical protein